MRSVKILIDCSNAQTDLNLRRSYKSGYIFCRCGSNVYCIYVLTCYIEPFQKSRTDQNKRNDICRVFFISEA